jgi:hypothetical protein
MASQKQQLIDGIIGLVEEFGAKVTVQDVTFLESQNVAWLTDYYRRVYSENVEKRKDKKVKEILEQAQAEARQQYEHDNHERLAAEQSENQRFYRELAFSHIGKLIIDNKRVKLSEASKQIIESWLNPGEGPLNVEWFLHVIKQPGLAEQLPWVSAKFEPTAADRELFNRCARLYNYSANQANFGMIQSTVGTGFSQFDIEQAIRTDDVQLSPPSQQELDEWRELSIQEHNTALLNMNSTELRAAARSESEQKRIQAQTQQANDNFEAVKQRDQANGFPSLPADFTKEQIKRAPVEKLKFLIKKFGNFQINSRLQGRG